MNWAEFMDKWRWSKADFDGYYGAQCVDLFNYYNRDVVGAPFVWCDGASDLWENIRNTAGDKYDRIDNTPEAVPQPGDVVIWCANGKLTGAAGHVAIATGRGDTSNFQSFDENWPLGSAAHEQWHTYDDVLGWYRPKMYEQAPEPVSVPPVAPVQEVPEPTPRPVIEAPQPEVQQPEVQQPEAPAPTEITPVEATVTTPEPVQEVPQAVVIKDTTDKSAGVIGFLKGKKTYIVAILIAVLNYAVSQGWIQGVNLELLNAILGALGLAALRAGVAHVNNKL